MSGPIYLFFVADLQDRHVCAHAANYKFDMSALTYFIHPDAVYAGLIALPWLSLVFPETPLWNRVLCALAFYLIKVFHLIHRAA